MYSRYPGFRGSRFVFLLPLILLAASVVHAFHASTTATTCRAASASSSSSSPSWNAPLHATHTTDDKEHRIQVQLKNGKTIYFPKAVRPIPRRAFGRPKPPRRIPFGRRRIQRTDQDTNKREIPSALLHNRTTDFVSHLNAVAISEPERSVASLLADDELMRMEICYYNLTEGDAPRLHFQKARWPYHGPVVRPNETSYKQVISFIARAGMNERGALLAESVAMRYEKHWGVEPTALVRGELMKAWLRARDIPRAHHQLLRMEKKYEATQDPLDAPNLNIYIYFLHSLSRSAKPSDEDVVHCSWAVFERLRDAFHSGANPYAPPDAEVYAAVARTLVRSDINFETLQRLRTMYYWRKADYQQLKDQPGLKVDAKASLPLFYAAHRCPYRAKAYNIAKEVYEDLRKSYLETNDSSYCPTDEHYQELFASCLKCILDDESWAGDQAQELVEKMEADGITPSRKTISLVIRILAGNPRKESVDYAVSLATKYNATHPYVQNTIIIGYAKSKNPVEADRRLRALESTGSVDYATYGLVLQSWYHSATEVGIDLALEKATALIENIIEGHLSDTHWSSHGKRTSFAFVDLVRLWASSGKPEAVDMVIATLQDLMLLIEKFPRIFRFHTKAFACAAALISQSGRSDVGDLILTWLDKVRASAARGDTAPPDLVTLSMVLKCLTQSSPFPLEDVLEIYREFLDKLNCSNVPKFYRPRTMTSILKRLLEIGDEARAFTLLQESISLGSQNPLRPDAGTFNEILRYLSIVGATEESFRVLRQMKSLAEEGYDTLPNSLTYMLVIKALLHTPNSLSARRLRSLTREIFYLYERGQIGGDIRLFNKITAGLCQVAAIDGGAAQDAFVVLKRLEAQCEKNPSITPNAGTYGHVCQAYGRSKLLSSSWMGEQVYLRAKALAAEGKIGSLRQNLYEGAVHSYMKSKAEGAPSKAEQVLIEMEKIRDQGHGYIAPTTHIYNCVLSAYAKSNMENKTAKAKEIFDRMESAHARGAPKCSPNGITYNWLIHCAGTSANSKDSEQTTFEKFELALRSFKALHSDNIRASPNSYSYETFIRACLSLLPSGEVQSHLIRQAFEMCRERGLVNAHIIEMTYNLLPEVKEGVNVGDLEDGTTWEFQFDEIVPKDWCYAIRQRSLGRGVILGKPEL